MLVSRRLAWASLCLFSTVTGCSAWTRRRRGIVSLPATWIGISNAGRSSFCEIFVSNSLAVITRTSGVRVFKKSMKSLTRESFSEPNAPIHSFAEMTSYAGA